MKTARFVCAIATAVFTTFSAIAAEQPPAAATPLRFAEVADVYDAIRRQLGPEAAGAVEFVDLRANTLKIDAAHPDAAKVRALVELMDTRPQKLVLAATVKRITPPTADTAAREEIIARPRIIATPGQPMTLSIADGANGMIKVELIVTAAK